MVMVIMIMAVVIIMLVMAMMIRGWSIRRIVKYRGTMQKSKDGE
jgi:hypothetical protein